MFAILFLICFNYSILRNLKDALVVTAKESGAEVIPFLKVWMILPAAFVATMIYTRLSSRFNQEKVFVMVISTFLTFFAVFAFLIYPLQDTIHPHAFADTVQGFLPAGFKGFVAMFRYWTFTLFYVVCELWGCIALTVLFWGFANQVTEVAEAKRFFGVFTIGGNLAAVAAGQVAVWITRTEYIPGYFGSTAWEQTLIGLICLVIISGLLAILLFRHLTRGVLKHQIEKEDRIRNAATTASVKKKGSLRASFRYLASSRYLLYIAVMVVSYNLVINLVEVIWKDRLRVLCPDPQEFNTYMNQLTTLMGVISTVLAILISFMIHRFGWTFTALVTPVSMVVTSIGFFAFLFLPEDISLAAGAILGASPLAIAAVFGGMQNCLSKSTKYSVFDATKEMAFIPLASESKIRGKAAIDGVGSRLGKSGGSLFHQVLLMFCGSLLASAPYVALFLLIVCGFWIVSVRRLGVEFDALAAQEPETLSPTTEAETGGIPVTV